MKPKKPPPLDGLRTFVQNPEEYPKSVFYHDSDIVVIYDKFPKATVHLLVLPKEAIDNLTSLKKDHVPLLKKMKEQASTITKKFETEHPGLTFRVGFHAVPSMRHLHLHVISQDFDSPCLKTKKHWNSFTTEFFLDIEPFIETLSSKGKIEIDRQKFEQILKGPLKCHKCKATQSTMPKLKEHIRKCTQ